jgi:hypothetical protein
MSPGIIESSNKSSAFSTARTVSLFFFQTDDHSQMNHLNPFSEAHAPNFQPKQKPAKRFKFSVSAGFQLAPPR